MIGAGFRAVDMYPGRSCSPAWQVLMNMVVKMVMMNGG